MIFVKLPHAIGKRQANSQYYSKQWAKHGRRSKREIQLKHKKHEKHISQKYSAHETKNTFK